MIEWRYIGSKRWDKCEECWLSYEKGVQHENSLHCYKLGIPVESLKISLEEFIKKIEHNKKEVTGKYSIFKFPTNLMSKGIIIFYFNSEEEMMEFYESIKEYIKDDNANIREMVFYNLFVNVDWIKSVNWRRGCPEYDKKFGDWRSWRK